MKISALTPGIDVPSSKYRIRQYIPTLADSGIFVNEFPAKIDYSAKLPGVLGRVRQKYIFPVSASWIGIKALSRISDVIQCNQYDAIWLNRAIVSSVFMERLLTKPLIYDVDDAIWLNNEKKIGKIARKATVILAGNSFIAEWFRKINSNVQIIPTAIDTKWFCPGESASDNVFRIVWTGTHQTMHYLLSIEKVLAKFLNERKDALLLVISDFPPIFRIISQEKVKFIKWTPEDELKALQGASVGIMPLFDSPWESGKCSFKMLKYMACGIPVLVSPVGMNKEVLSKGEIGLSAINDEEWISGLDFLFYNPDKCKQMGLKGIQVVKNFYSLDNVSEKLVRIIRNI